MQAIFAAVAARSARTTGLVGAALLLSTRGFGETDEGGVVIHCEDLKRLCVEAEDRVVRGINGT